MVAYLNNIITGMSKILPLFVLFFFSGCWTEFYPPKNFIEDDLIGSLVYRNSGTKSLPVQDKKLNKVYKEARLILKFNKDHTYEEFFVNGDQKNAFRSSWKIDEHDAVMKEGYIPVLIIDTTRYVPYHSEFARREYYDPKQDTKLQILRFNRNTDELELCAGDMDAPSCYIKLEH